MLPSLFSPNSCAHTLGHNTPQVSSCCLQACRWTNRKGLHIQIYGKLLVLSAVYQCTHCQVCLVHLRVCFSIDSPTGRVQELVCSFVSLHICCRFVSMCNSKLPVPPFMCMGLCTHMHNNLTHLFLQSPQPRLKDEWISNHILLNIDIPDFWFNWLNAICLLHIWNFSRILYLFDGFEFVVPLDCRTPLQTKYPDHITTAPPTTAKHHLQPPCHVLRATKSPFCLCWTS